jgi:hypothetical protein
MLRLDGQYGGVDGVSDVSAGWSGSFNWRGLERRDGDNMG